MSLLRFLVRSLFTSAFVVDGVRKVALPVELVPEAEAFTARVTPPVQRVVPSGYSSHVSDQAEPWVYICGAVEIVGGVMFAIGAGRRLGACLPANASILNTTVVLSERGADIEEKQARRPDVLKNMVPLDAPVLMTQDLQRRPSAPWRRRSTSHKLRRVNARAARRMRQVAVS